MNSDDTQIEFGCLTSGDPHARTPLFRTHAGDRSRHKERGGCRPGYAPYFGRLEGDSLSRTLESFLIQDVNASELKDAQVVMRVYRPVAHFTDRW